LSGSESSTSAPAPTTVFWPIEIRSTTVTPSVTAAQRPMRTWPPSTEPAETLAKSSITQSCSI
jgi:hypothetical protein